MTRRTVGFVLACVVVVALIGAFFAARSSRHKALLSALPPIPLDRFNPSARILVSRTLQALEKEPLRADLWGEMGYVLSANGIFTEPGPCFLRAEELEPSNHRWPHLYAVVTQANDRPATIAALKRSLKARPNVVPTLAMLAEFYLDDGLDAEADALLRPIVSDKTNDARLLWLMARIEANAGAPARALEMAKRAAAIPPHRRKVHTLLAQLHQQTGNAAEARKETRLLELLPPAEEEPPWPDSLAEQIPKHSRHLGIVAIQARGLVESGDSAGAIRLLEDLAPEDRKTPTVQSVIAMAKGSLGDIDAAKAILDGVSAQDDLNVEYARGVLAQLQGKDAEAADHYLKVTKLQPTQEKVRSIDSVYLSLGRCLQSIRKEDDAAAAYEQALKLNPGNLEALIRLASLRLDKGRKADAAKLLEDAALIEPNHETIKELQKRATG